MQIPLSKKLKVLIEEFRQESNLENNREAIFAAVKLGLTVVSPEKPKALVYVPQFPAGHPSGRSQNIDFGHLNADVIKYRDAVKLHVDTRTSKTKIYIEILCLGLETKLDKRLDVVD